PSSLAGALGAVFGAALLAALNPDGVQGSADDVVANSRKVLDPAAANHHHRVLLQVVPHPGDVGGHLDAVGQPHPGHLAKRRVRLLRRRGVDARANTSLLWALAKRWALALDPQPLPTLADQLANRRH